jgi:hypothetical protein
MEKAPPGGSGGAFVVGPAPGRRRPAHLASLGRYVQLGEQTSAQVTANADPAARRKPR